jgi:hypothetical protein
MSHNNQENKPQPSIYRFKFTQDFTQTLFEFSKLHQFDERDTFREAWESWLEENNDEVCKETRYLSNIGYEGDVLDKMYKSSRYYFRKKPTAKVEPKKRRNYVSMDRELLDQMDKHITDSMKNDGICPANGYDEFCLNNTGIVKGEVCRLLEEGLDGEGIKIKLKKTYKNRYFQLSH